MTCRFVFVWFNHFPNGISVISQAIILTVFLGVINYANSLLGLAAEVISFHVHALVGIEHTVFRVVLPHKPTYLLTSQSR